MNRRKFLAASAALTSPAVGAAQTAQKKLPAKTLMKLGMQDHMSDDDLHFYSAIGVEHVCTSLPSRRLDEKWSVEGLTKERERVESFGIHLAVPEPGAAIRV